MNASSRTFSPHYGYVSFASGREAGVLQSIFHQHYISELQSVSLGGARLSALSALDGFYLTARERNWDGEDSLAVSEDTYENARRFISIMPRSWVKPEISADPDGEVAVEWSTGPRRRLSLSIGPDQTLSYAWLNGSERGNATDSFVDEIPAGVVNQVNRLVEG